MIKRKSLRPPGGAILPLLAIATTTILALLCLVCNVSAHMLRGQLLEFTAESAALYALGHSCNKDGSYRPTDSEKNMREALSTFMKRECDTKNNTITEHRQGDVQLKLQLVSEHSSIIDNLVLKLCNQDNSEKQAVKLQTHRGAEVIGQPATELGLSPLLAKNGLRQYSMFPLALKYEDFAMAALPEQKATRYKIDFGATRSSTHLPHEQTMHGCLVTLEDAHQGQDPTETLLEHLQFFSGKSINHEMPPAIGRGDTLTAVDRNGPGYKSHLSEINKALKSLPLNRYYILPVCTGSSEAYTNVIGFGRLKLIQTVDDRSVMSFVFDIAESTVIRNAVFSGRRTLTRTNPVPLNIARGPFAPRKFVNGLLTEVYRGVALAPAVSPRDVLPSL